MFTGRRVGAVTVMVAVLAVNSLWAQETSEVSTIIDHFTQSAGPIDTPKVLGTGVGDLNATRSILVMAPSFACDVDSNVRSPSHLLVSPFMVDYVADFALQYCDFGGQRGGLVDLTASGGSDRFVVDLDSLSAPVTLEIRVFSPFRGYPFAHVSRVVVNVAHAGSLEIPFAAFLPLAHSGSTTGEANFTEVSCVELHLRNTSAPIRIDALRLAGDASEATQGGELTTILAR